MNWNLAGREGKVAWEVLVGVKIVCGEHVPDKQIGAHLCTKRPCQDQGMGRRDEDKNEKDEDEESDGMGMNRDEQDGTRGSVVMIGPAMPLDA